VDDTKVKAKASAAAASAQSVVMLPTYLQKTNLFMDRGIFFIVLASSAHPAVCLDAHYAIFAALPAEVE
jgi:hypothetical protein